MKIIIEITGSVEVEDYVFELVESINRWTPFTAESMSIVKEENSTEE